MFVSSLRACARAHGASTWVGLVCVAAMCAAVAGCGRRATQADCQLIVDKSVELQAKALGDSNAEVQKRVEQVRAALQGDIASCEGRRVTDHTIACVQAARTTEELDRCLH